MARLGGPRQGAVSSGECGRAAAGGAASARVGGCRRLGVGVDGRRASTAAPDQMVARGLAGPGGARLGCWAHGRLQLAAAARARCGGQHRRVAWGGSAGR
jgi:hypothetical protein